MIKEKGIKYVSTKEAMKLTGISQAALCNQTKKGKLQKFRRRRNIYYLLSEIVEYNAMKKV